jgi:hypothetical protein
MKKTLSTLCVYEERSFTGSRSSNQSDEEKIGGGLDWEGLEGSGRRGRDWRGKVSRHYSFFKPSL